MNEQIKYPEVRLICNNVDRVMTIKEALEMAEQEDLDLMLASDTVKPPICKLVNYSKMQYEKEKQAKANKNVKHAELKEIKLGCHIMDHDIEIKAKNARRIIEEGDKVKVAIYFRGREKAYINSGASIVNKCVALLSDIATPAGPIKTEINQVYVVLNPK